MPESNNNAVNVRYIAHTFMGDRISTVLTNRETKSSYWVGNERFSKVTNHQQMCNTKEEAKAVLREMHNEKISHYKAFIKRHKERISEIDKM